MLSNGDVGMTLMNIRTNASYMSNLESFLASKGDGKLWRVLVVRDPLERLLSGYIDKCSLSYYSDGDLCLGYTKGGAVPTFKQFLQNATSVVPHKLDDHFNNQWRQCGQEKYYDTVIKWSQAEGSTNPTLSLGIQVKLFFEHLELPQRVSSKFFSVLWKQGPGVLHKRPLGGGHGNCWQ